jgi:uncharacterized membrane protein (DUF2068 family)
MNRGFVAIIAFKCFKGLLFLLVGVATLQIMRLSEMPSAAELARFFGVTPENEIVRRIAAVLSNTTPQKAAGLAAVLLFVGAIFLVEATLLIFRVWWSTYLMIGLTALGLPLEIYEIIRRPASLHRYVLLLINVAILAFLWWRRNEFRAKR